LDSSDDGKLEANVDNLNSEHTGFQGHDILWH